MVDTRNGWTYWDAVVEDEIVAVEVEVLDDAEHVKVKVKFVVKEELGVVLVNVEVIKVVPILFKQKALWCCFFKSFLKTILGII